jgi:hypothetical protein
VPDGAGDAAFDGSEPAAPEEGVADDGAEEPGEAWSDAVEDDDPPDEEHPATAANPPKATTPKAAALATLSVSEPDPIISIPFTPRSMPLLFRPRTPRRRCPVSCGWGGDYVRSRKGK